MYLFLILVQVILNILTNIVDVAASEMIVRDDTKKYNMLSEHTLVTDSNVFPYVAAVLKMSTYLCAGALIDDVWVITASDPLFTLRESSRMLRVRLGSINYKKGGVLFPVKFINIHPYFNDANPQFDIALIRLSQPITSSSSLHPIRLQKKRKPITAIHYTVTSWFNPLPQNSGEASLIESMETINRRRILSVSHLHPADSNNCSDYLDSIGVNDKETLMCLDPSLESDPCVKDTGAPVVLNGILWGVISSWKSEDCDVESAPIFANLVSAKDINAWIHAMTHGHSWKRNKEKYQAIDRAPVRINKY